MPRFKVVAGAHIQEGKVFTKGKVVNSDHDLATTFKGKFEAIDKPEELEAGKERKALEEGSEEEEETTTKRHRRRHKSSEE